MIICELCRQELLTKSMLKEMKLCQECHRKIEEEIAWITHGTGKQYSPQPIPQRQEAVSK